jgi:UDP-glucuronate 4-epimerase
MTTLITGIAGFIGAHVARALLSRGETLVGIDNINDYYDPALKEARLKWVAEAGEVEFLRADLADQAALSPLSGRPVTRVIHLAAQAGVRYSLENPHAYVNSNLIGHLNVLEFCRAQENFEQLIYASSSSVYGGNTKLPFAESDPVDHPVSLYAATKKSDELMSHCYSHLYRIPQTGLRFFTVYGPWGRPDMAMWLFTKAILADRPIRIFNHGDMQRDFTYVDDIVAGILAACDKPIVDRAKVPPHRLYNIGNNHPEALLDMIAVLEDALGKKAIREFEPMQPGDVKATYADITLIERDLGYTPTTPIQSGIPNFVDWYREYHSR